MRVPAAPTQEPRIIWLSGNQEGDRGMRHTLSAVNPYVSTSNMELLVWANPKNRELNGSGFHTVPRGFLSWAIHCVCNWAKQYNTTQYTTYLNYSSVSHHSHSFFLVIMPNVGRILEDKYVFVCDMVSLTDGFYSNSVQCPICIIAPHCMFAVCWPKCC